jgi:hypothetical protein
MNTTLREDIIASLDRLIDSNKIPGGNGICTVSVGFLQLLKDEFSSMCSKIKLQDETIVMCKGTIKYQGEQIRKLEEERDLLRKQTIDDCIEAVKNDMLIVDENSETTYDSIFDTLNRLKESTGGVENV